MSAMILVYTDADFRAAFPAFSNMQQFPTSVLQMYFTQGTSYISDVDAGWLNGSNRQLALYQMTAHLAALSVIIASGQTTGLLQDTTIDKISISLTPPPLPNQWQWWLNQTPYGQQLLGLLQVNSVGGFWVGGSAVRSGFRNAFGGFGG